MFARAETGTVVGVEAHGVIVECQKGKGLPGMAMVGLARGAVKESMVRVRAALQSSHITLGSYKWVVNLLPAELPKEASALDLALAMALWAATEPAFALALQGRRFYGELSLSGFLEPVHGTVLMADLARQRGDKELIVPLANAEEAAVIPGIHVIGAQSLHQVIQHVLGHSVLPKATAASTRSATHASSPCLSDVRGQEKAKRALEIAAAGGHNLLMIGPPGSGKTMLARRLSGLLGDMSPEERIEVTRIHSAAGLLKNHTGFLERPFRSPHHSASEPALCGGGSIPKPGEITLAHRGVLFLDELPEFSRKSLESLREPLEERRIHIARAAMSLCFPAHVLLVAAMNPCPCGRYRGDIKNTLSDKKPSPKTLPCMCSFDSIQRYRSKISGPLLDRIDLHVLVDAVPYRDYAAEGSGETSAQVRTRVLKAQKQQHKRWDGSKQNSSMSQNDLRTHVPLSEESLCLIESAIDKRGLSTRAIGRILKVARTIADLEETETVYTHHIQEAIQLRVADL